MPNKRMYYFGFGRHAIDYIEFMLRLLSVEMTKVICLKCLGLKVDRSADKVNPIHSFTNLVIHSKKTVTVFKLLLGCSYSCSIFIIYDFP